MTNESIFFSDGIFIWSCNYAFTKELKDMAEAYAITRSFKAEKYVGGGSSNSFALSQIKPSSPSSV